MEAVIYICLGLMLICGVLAVMLRSLIKSAIALAGASHAGHIMYTLDSVWAAIFELSVCSGLVTVILSALSACPIQISKIWPSFMRIKSAWPFCLQS